MIAQLFDRTEAHHALRQFGFDRAVGVKRIGHAIDNAGFADAHTAPAWEPRPARPVRVQPLARGAGRRGRLRPPGQVASNGFSALVGRGRRTAGLRPWLCRLRRRTRRPPSGRSGWFVVQAGARDGARGDKDTSSCSSIACEVVTGGRQVELGSLQTGSGARRRGRRSGRGAQRCGMSQIQCAGVARIRCSVRRPRPAAGWRDCLAMRGSWPTTRLSAKTMTPPAAVTVPARMRVLPRLNSLIGIPNPIRSRPVRSPEFRPASTQMTLRSPQTRRHIC